MKKRGCRQRKGWRSWHQGSWSCKVAPPGMPCRTRESRERVAAGGVDSEGRKANGQPTGQLAIDSRSNAKLLSVDLQNGCSWEMFFMQKMIQKHCVSNFFLFVFFLFFCFFVFLVFPLNWDRLGSHKIAQQIAQNLNFGEDFARNHCKTQCFCII